MDKQFSQLIQTKVCAPRIRSNIIDRKRLIDLINDEPDEILTLISAPAGYGKTTLMIELSEELAKTGTKTAWYTLDSNDNDSNLFCSYLVTSLNNSLEIDTATSPITKLLSLSTSFNIEKILSDIINAIVEKDQKCLLVLDDYQSITSPAIHSALAFFLDHLPEKMHVIIGSRSDPPIPLARLRAKGQMIEIRAADLQFTLEEAKQFFNETMHLALPSEVVAEIDASTEGWITGLQLAALSIRGQRDNLSYASRFGGSNRYLVDYLLQEVLDHQPAEIKQFLLSTSVLERLCGPLCNTVLGGQYSSSESVLHQLEKENLFIMPLDEENHWYRYHQLFQDFLQTQLKKTEPDQIPILQRAASEWYASQSLLQEAVLYAFKTQDWVYTAGMVEKFGILMFMHSEISVLKKWCESLPEEVFLTHPMLCILHGWTLGLSYRKENRIKVVERLQQAEQAASILEDTQQKRLLNSQIALMRPVLGLIPDPAIDPKQELALAQKAFDLLPENTPLRSLAIAAVGYSHLALQNLPMANETLTEYKRLSLAGKNYYAATVATFYLASIAYYQGQIKRAKKICHEQLVEIEKVITNPKQDLPAIGCLYIIIGSVLLEENQLYEAEESLLRGMDLIIWTNNPFLRLIGCITLLHLYEIQGREKEGFKLLDDMEDAWPDIAFCTQGLRLMHLIRTVPKDPQTLVKAESWCQTFFSFTEGNILFPGLGPLGAAQAYYVASLIWVQAQILLGNPGNTLLYLEQQQNVAKTQGLNYRLIELSLAEAQVRKALGEVKQSLNCLELALELAKLAGCIRIFDQSPALNHMLKEAAHCISNQGYIEHIIKILGSPSGSFTEQKLMSGLSPKGVANVKGTPITLTERELEVLHLIVYGASNQKIANQFFVTVGTVKSHINHILGKLDAHNRLEAVARARELGLL